MLRETAGHGRDRADTTGDKRQQRPRATSVAPLKFPVEAVSRGLPSSRETRNYWRGTSVGCKDDEGAGASSLEEGLRELGLFSLEQAEGGSYDAYRYLEGGCQEDGARLFSAVPSARTRGHGHQLQRGKFHLNMRKTLSALRVRGRWDRLPRAAAGSPSLGTPRPAGRLRAACWRRACSSGGWAG